jgi:hypothetical protein
LDCSFAFVLFQEALGGVMESQSVNSIEELFPQYSQLYKNWHSNTQTTCCSGVSYICEIIFEVSGDLEETKSKIACRFGINIDGCHVAAPYLTFIACTKIAQPTKILRVTFGTLHLSVERAGCSVLITPIVEPSIRLWRPSDVRSHHIRTKGRGI